MSGSQFVTWAAGSKITAAGLDNMQPVHAVKPGPTVITNSTTVADDPDLQVVIAAAGTYIIEGFLLCTGAAIGTGDLKVGFAYTGTVTFGQWANISIATSGATAAAATGTQFGFQLPYGVNGGTYTPSTLSGTLVAGGAGTLKIQWAQNTANGTTGTTMRQGSWLRVTQTA